LPQVDEMASPAHNGTTLTNARARYEYVYDTYGVMVQGFFCVKMGNIQTVFREIPYVQKNWHIYPE
jgi:hypothetical protein